MRLRSFVLASILATGLQAAAALAHAASAPVPVTALALGTLQQDQGAQPSAPTDKGTVDINVTEHRTETTTHDVWYTDPVWIAVGVIVLVLFVVLIALAAKGGGGATIVKG
jgi:hypothetical protein